MKSLIFAFLLAFSLGCYAQTDAKDITILLADDNPIYQKIAKAISDSLQRDTDSDFNLTVLSADNTTLRQLSQSSLLIPIGDKVSEMVLKIKPNNPIIFSFIEQDFIESHQPELVRQSWAAAVVGQPIKRLIYVADKLLQNRDKKTIVVLVSEQHAYFHSDIISTLPPLAHARVKLIEVDPEDIDVRQVESALFGAGALLSTHEKAIWSRKNAKWLLRQAYIDKVPVIGDSKRFLKAGALLSVYSSMQDIADSTSQLVNQWLKSAELPDQVYFSDYEVGLNKSVQKALNISNKALDDIEVTD